MNVKVDDRAYRALMARLGGGEQHVKVGVLGSHGGGDQEGDSDATVAMIALIHEFGSDDGKVPERSFIRRALIVHEREIAAMQARLARQVVAGNLTMARAHEQLGAYVAGLVKALIAEGDIKPENAPSTIERKGSSRPLVDTGQLVGSINFEVAS